MRASIFLSAAIVMGLAAPTPAFAELSAGDREAILDVVERFRQAVIATDEEAVLDVLGPSFSEPRRAALTEKIRGFKGMTVSFTLATDPANVTEAPGGRARLAATQSFRAQGGGSNLSVNGISAEFEFEKSGEGAEAAWLIASTDADDYWSLGAIFKLVGSIFGFIGAGCFLLILVPVGLIIYFSKRKKGRELEDKAA